MPFREEYSPADVEAAREFGIGNYDADRLSFVGYEESMDHIRLIESIHCGVSNLTRFLKGWAIGKSDTEILTALASINKTPPEVWAQLLQGFKTHTLPPVIVVHKQMCDGVHRTVLCYLFNQPVRVARFTAPPLN